MEIVEFYVPWDAGMLFSGIKVLVSNVGVIFNVGLWIFLIVIGIALVWKIVSGLVG